MSVLAATISKGDLEIGALVLVIVCLVVWLVKALR